MAIISERLAGVIKTTPNWYDDTEFITIYKKTFGNGVADPEELQEDTWDLIGWFANALMANEVLLGNVISGFNDDDRKGKFQGSTHAPVDGVIVHHTGTKDNISVWELNALGLLRLYLPFFMDTNPNSFINFLVKIHPELADRENRAPASGHYVMIDDKEVQTFAGYHVIFYPDGSMEELLDKDHVGFQAGNRDVNIRSYGAAFAGNYEGKGPTKAAKDAFKKWVVGLNTDDVQITHLDSHKHVRLKHTTCPGKWFSGFYNSKQFKGLRPYPMN